MAPHGIPGRSQSPHDRDRPETGFSTGTTVLYHWPAALAHASAGHRAGDVIHVAVDESLSPVRLPGTRLHRLVRFEERVQWSASPPRVRLEDALSSMAGDAPTRADDLAVVADACRRRVTTPERLAGELRSHPRLRRRRWMLDVLDEASAGVQSLLESTYRRRVERAHGLPTPERQVRERTEHDGHPRRAATWSSGSSRTCLRATTVTR